MGVSVGAPGRKSGRRRRGVPRYGAMAEINMTPFIDVMLVLLIIFMVAAPLLATGVPLDLPQTKAAALNIDQKPVSIAIDEKGEIFLMDEPVAARTTRRANCRPPPRPASTSASTCAARKSVNYGRVAEVMSLITTAGYKKVALVTEQEK